MLNSLVKWKTFIYDATLLFLLSLGFFWRPLFENKYLFFGGDLAKTYYPHLLYVVSSFKNLQLPILDSFSSGQGQTPFLAEMGWGTFYPPNALFVLLPWSMEDVNLGFHLLETLLIFHIFLAALFLYLLCRSGLELNRWGALFSAISFAFGGIWVAHIHDLIFIYSITWLPLVFLLFIKGLAKKELRYFIFAGGVLGISILSGNQEGPLYAGCLILGYATYNSWVNKDPLVLYPVLGLCIFLAAGYGATSLFPADILGQGSPRFVETHPFRMLLSFAMPDFYPKTTNWWETVTYIGVIPLIFAAFGVCIKNVRNTASFFLIVAVVSIGMVMLFSSKTMASSLPDVGIFGHPTRIRVLTTFALSVLAGFGMDFFTSKMAKTYRTLFHTYYRGLWWGLMAIICIVLPITYANMTVTIGDKAINKANCVAWFTIFYGFGYMLFSLRHKMRGDKLAYVILLLSIVDIFSFWCNFHPASYDYAETYHVDSPHHYYSNTSVLKEKNLRIALEGHKVKYEFIIDKTYLAKNLNDTSNFQLVSDPQALDNNALYVPLDKEGIISGPYEPFPRGGYIVKYNLKTDNNTLSDEIVFLAVTSAGGVTRYSKKSILAEEFKKQNEYQEFVLPFYLKKSSRLEFVLSTKKRSNIWIDSIKVVRLTDEQAFWKVAQEAGFKSNARLQ